VGLGPQNFCSCDKFFFDSIFDGDQVSPEPAGEVSTELPKASSSSGGWERSPHWRIDMGNVIAADLLGPLCRALVPDDGVLRIAFWDGSSVEAENPKATVVVRSPLALRRILFAPRGLGVARAYVTGELDLEGDLIQAVRSLTGSGPTRVTAAAWAATLRAALPLGILGLPPAAPAEEVRLRGWRHSTHRDSQAISHHYDLGNDFYKLVLGETLAYSCALFTTGTESLAEAQLAKYDLVCRKLGLGPGMRLLDVGCGWGEMAIRAAGEYGAQVVGITISAQQRELAAERIERNGLAERAEIRLLDYRELEGEQFDAISSIGMFEHVGRGRLKEYFDTLAGVLRPGGRMLNHAISAPGGSRASTNSFIGRYVFPDGELQDVSTVTSAMGRSGLDITHVESLGKHYPPTLERWISNLEANWDQAVELVGEQRARVWRLYMAGGIADFEQGRYSVHQVLGTKPEQKS
jgi:cyclopropane-fatty-acyl-phospholipid synthase